LLALGIDGHASIEDIKGFILSFVEVGRRFGPFADLGSGEIEGSSGIDIRG
jgi:hypothetical protein